MTASDRDLLSEPLPDGDCSYRVLADAAGVRVARDGAEVVRAPGLPVPQVAQLATDVPTGATAGLGVTLHTDARYESAPSVPKTVLLLLHAAALVLAWRCWRGCGAGLVAPRPGPADAALLGVLAPWVLLSPVNFDDPWYLLMARGGVESGSIGNAIYMFNVTENPFVASQYALWLWGSLGQFLGGGWG